MGICRAATGLNGSMRIRDMDGMNRKPKQDRAAAETRKKHGADVRAASAESRQAELLTLEARCTPMRPCAEARCPRARAVQYTTCTTIIVNGRACMKRACARQYPQCRAPYLRAAMESIEIPEAEMVACERALHIPNIDPDAPERSGTVTACIGPPKIERNFQPKNSRRDGILTVCEESKTRPTAAVKPK